MAFTKMHNWDPDPAADGPEPAASTRCVGLQAVRMSDADGEWFGYEQGATLIPCVRVTNSAAKQAEIDQAQTDLSDRSGEIDSFDTSVAAVRAKRDADPPEALTDADRDVIADLALGRY